VKLVPPTPPCACADCRAGHPPFMTKIHDANGSRLVHIPRREKRRRGAGRFAEVKVGDQLMQRVISRWQAYEQDPIAANDPALVDRSKDCGFAYAIVTDLWFDPVKGEDDPVAGQMVAIRNLRQGRPLGRKSPHTIRGLASNGWQYADRDDIAHWEAVRAAHEEGLVIGIGRAQVIRKRPKISGPTSL
jgi:hypothetical protein